MSAEHTPGPWVLLPTTAPRGTLMIAAKAEGKEPLVCVMEHSKAGPIDYSTAKANAEFIVNAAAECERLKALNAELAEALQGVIGWVPGRTAWHTDEPRKDVERACAALEKHKGDTT